MTQEMEVITEKLQDVNVFAALEVFTEIPNHASIYSPKGEVDLLIGINCMELQPALLHCQGNLGLYQSMFRTGLILGGSHPDIFIN